MTSVQKRKSTREAWQEPSSTKDASKRDRSKSALRSLLAACYKKDSSSKKTKKSQSSKKTSKQSRWCGKLDSHPLRPAACSQCPQHAPTLQLLDADTQDDGISLMSLPNEGNIDVVSQTPNSNKSCHTILGNQQFNVPLVIHGSIPGPGDSGFHSIRPSTVTLQNPRFRWCPRKAWEDDDSTTAPSIPTLKEYMKRKKKEEKTERMRQKKAAKMEKLKKVKEEKLQDKMERKHAKIVWLKKEIADIDEAETVTIRRMQEMDTLRKKLYKMNDSDLCIANITQLEQHIAELEKHLYALKKTRYGLEDKLKIKQTKFKELLSEQKKVSTTVSASSSGTDHASIKVEDIDDDINEDVLPPRCQNPVPWQARSNSLSCPDSACLQPQPVKGRSTVKLTSGSKLCDGMRKFMNSQLKKEVKNIAKLA